MAEIIVDLNKIETDDELLVRLYPAKGEKGEQGSQGAKGDKGETGDSGGSAVVVDTVADMIDTTQAYLYVGNESGYTKGDWYYYDGTEWVSGGQYGADGGINTNARNILKYILERVAYTEQGMQTYVDALYQALAQGGGGGGTTTYMIMNALTHVTNSNTATGIDEGESYTATLTADSGYSLGTVAVTMGGEDITSTAYSNGEINIASVTGDVIITATANAPIVGWYYPFNGSLLSAGTKDFGFEGVENYTTGRNGTDQAYFHEVTTEGTSSTDTLGLKSIGFADVPDFSGEFTVSFWYKSLTELKGHPFMWEKVFSTAGGTMTAIGSAASNIKTGYSLNKGTMSKNYGGFIIQYTSSNLEFRMSDTDGLNGVVYQVRSFPSGFSTKQWHHYAVTRDSNDLMRFFIDGEIIFTATVSGTLASFDWIAIGNHFTQTVGATTLMVGGYSDIVQDLYISDEVCKWNADFDATSITY